MKDWFNIRAQEDGGQTIHIKGVIGYYPNIEDEIRFRFNQLNDSLPLEVRINSIGGEPRTAKAIYTMLQSWPAKTTAIIENDCMSSATLPACGCDVVIIHELGTYMVHEPEIKPEKWLRENEAQSMTDYIRITKDHFVSIYQSFTGQDEETIRDWMQQTKFFSAQEAVESGFANEVRNVVPQIEIENDYEMAARMTGVSEERFNIEGRDKSPDESQTKQKTTMTKDNKEEPSWLAKKLAALWNKGDSENYDDADAYVDVKELQAKADRIEELEDDLETVKSERDELKEKLDEQQEEEEEEIEEEFEAELDAAVDDYKIKAGKKEMYRERYEGDLEGLKAALDLIDEGAVKGGGSKEVESPKNNGVPARVSASGSNKVRARMDKLFDG